MTPSLLYQDDDVLVIDKPPGMVVNRAESVKGETVQDWVEKKLSAVSFQSSDTKSDFYTRAGIVHRIDKETSGILLIAKHPESFIELQRQFKSREVKKTYLALVHGTIPEDGIINAPVGRLPWNREQFGVVPGGKESKTQFKRVSTFSLSSRSPDVRRGRSDLYNKDCRVVPQGGSPRNDRKDEMVSLVEVYPETGRTHQIRVHFKYIGHPLLGDYLYAGRVQSRNDRKDIPRVMLHAWKIAFTHPVTRKPLAYEAPIPDDMRRIIPSSTNYE